MSWYSDALRMEMGLIPEHVPLVQRLKKENTDEEVLAEVVPPRVVRIEEAATD